MVKPKVDQEYIVMYSDDGTITLVPKIQDPFSEGPEGEYYEKMSGMILHLRERTF